MALRTFHAGRFAAASGAILALVATAVIVLAGSGAASRASVFGQLERPAIEPAASVGPRPVAVTIPAGAYRLHLAITPNRAGARNAVVIALTRHGIPVRGARATVTYSMSAMDMQSALTSSLREIHPGGYSVREPVLGMPGSWAMRFAVRPARGASFSVTVSDLLR